jgi:hypothetical protein
MGSIPRPTAIGRRTGTVTRMTAVASIRQPRISRTMFTRIMKTQGLSDTDVRKAATSRETWARVRMRPSSAAAPRMSVMPAVMTAVSRSACRSTRNLAVR